MGKCKKCCKEKFDVKIKCKPTKDCENQGSSKWNLSIFPPSGASSFRPVPTQDTEGQTTVVNGVVDNIAEFAITGTSSTAQTDLINTVYTLEERALCNSVKGFSIYIKAISSSDGTYIKFIQNDLAYDTSKTAKIINTNIVEVGNTVAPATVEYEGWTLITHELD